MHDHTPHRFWPVIVLAVMAAVASLASAQVQVSGSIAYRDSIESHLNSGEELFTLLGIGTDPDDGVTYLVCQSDTAVACPSDDNIRIYRHDTPTNEWVFEASIGHQNQVNSAIVDVSGDTIAVGRVFGSVLGNDGLDVYRRGPNGWTHEAADILPADHFVYDQFGYSVSLDGDFLAAAALQEGDDAVPSANGPGSVYVFERTNGVWTEIEKISSDQAGNGDRFGASVAIRATASGWRLIVGAPDHATDPRSTNTAGVVYAFEHENSSTSLIGSVSLSAAPGAVGDFGGSGIGFDGDIVAIAENTAMPYYALDPSQGFVNLGALVSASHLYFPVVENRMILIGDPQGGLAASGLPGVTLVQEDLQGGWMSTRYPAPPGITVSDRFGASVGFNGTLIAAGIPNLGYAGAFSGGVWTQTTGANTYPTGLILEGLGSAGSNLGESIAMDGTRAAVGMPGSPDPCAQGSVGAVRTLERQSDGWARGRDLYAPPGASGVGFGWAVAINADTMAVGMPGFVNASSGGTVGAVFMYNHDGLSWNLTQTLEGTLAAAGFAESIALGGDDLLVGEPTRGGAGAVTQYRRDGAGVWNLVGTSTVAGITQSARFGHALSLHDGVLLVGAPHDQNNTGSVHAYTVAGGVLAFDQTLAVAGAQTDAHAGWALAQNNDHAFIGLPFWGSIPAPAANGLVTAVPKAGGSFGPGTSIPDPGGPGLGFGRSIAANGSLVAVSSHDPGAEVVRLLAFNGTDFQLIQSAPSPTGATPARYGAAIGLGAGTLLVGAPDEDSPLVPDGGRVHLFDFEVSYTVPECDMDMLEDRIQWIEDPAPNNSELFAYSVEADGGFAIAGVPYDRYSFVHNGITIDTFSAGKAIIYQRTGLRTWSPVAEFRGNRIDTDPGPGHHSDWLGWSVDIEGDTAVAGGTQAIDEATGWRSGAVQVYEKNLGVWARTHELFPSNNSVPGADLISYFGGAVDLSSTGNLLAVGAWNSYLGGVTGTGAAMVYERSAGDWVESNILSPPGAGVGDHDGESVSVEENWAAVGSPDDHADNLGGAVHLFRRVSLGDWDYHSTLLLPTNDPGGAFGRSIEISRSDLGLTLVVGAPRVPDGFTTVVGATFVYMLDPGTEQWGLVQRLDPDVFASSVSYGTDVSIDHNTIAVGGPNMRSTEPPPASWSGGVDVYNLDVASGVFVRRVTIRPDPTQWANANGWGDAIGLSGGTVFLGTRYADGDPFDFANANRNWGAMIAFDIICTPECRPDLNGDGAINFVDITLFIAAFNAGDPVADFNRDGSINFFDFSAFIAAFNLGC